MKKIFLVSAAICQLASLYAQETTPSPPASSSAPPTAADVEALRQQVQSLTEMVKSLQQQVKDQQAMIKGNSGGESTLPQNPETTPAPVAAGSPSPAPSAAPLFPTQDSAVVAGAPSAGSTSPPPVTPDGTATGAAGSFPTTDSNVVASTETSSTTGIGSSLTAPITIGGGKAYMNISLDAVFALAGSSANDLDRIEVGDHDPQQRGFNARNIELAFDGAVDPISRGSPTSCSSWITTTIPMSK